MDTAFVFEAASGGLLKEVLETVFSKYVVLILAAVILIAISFALKKVRAFINHLFRKIPVQGKWKTKLTRAGAVEEHEVAELHQLLSYVWGKTTTVQQKVGEPVRVYKVRGRILGEKLCMTYGQREGPGFDHGAIVLDVQPEGDKMLGYEVGTDIKTNMIGAFVYDWEKI